MLHNDLVSAKGTPPHTRLIGGLHMCGQFCSGQYLLVEFMQITDANIFYTNQISEKKCLGGRKQLDMHTLTLDGGSRVNWFGYKNVDHVAKDHSVINFQFSTENHILSTFLF